MQHMHIDIYKYIEIYQKKTVSRYLCRVLHIHIHIYIRRRCSRTSVQCQIYIRSLPLGKSTGRCSSGLCPWNDI